MFFSTVTVHCAASRAHAVKQGNKRAAKVRRRPRIMLICADFQVKSWSKSSRDDPPETHAAGREQSALYFACLYAA
jgi:hypothetical protein